MTRDRSTAFRTALPARNWLYNGHAYHQGDSYGPYRFSWDTFPLFIFDRMGFPGIYNREQAQVPYWFLYSTRPDGQRLRGGDTFMDSTAIGEPWGEGIGTLLVATYYHDPVLLGHYLRQQGNRANETLFELLWRDTTLKPAAENNLPLSRYFGTPFGWTVARTGWDENAVVADMRVNEYNFTNHQHLDGGAFQIFYKGALAIDSGVYHGSTGAYGSEHGLNYSWRTIAHNSLLIYDPQEKFGGRGYGNDGGQRLPSGRAEPRNLDTFLAPDKGYRTGTVLAHGFGPDAQAPTYTLLQGDITAAYSNKVKNVTRSFVFLNLKNPDVPAAVVVFDRVVSSNPGFQKFWLLHTLEEPSISGATASVDRTQHESTGRLNLDVLLPAADNLDLHKIGGPGKEFWVFGKNYPNDPDARLLRRGSAEPGSWRIEASPKSAAGEDLFLNVMQVTGRTHPARRPVRRLETPDRVGCLIESPDVTYAVLFRRDAARSDNPVEFTIPGEHPARILITDLTVSAESGAGWLEGPPGAWQLSR